MPSGEREDIRLLKSNSEIWAHAQELVAKKVSLPSMQSWIRPARLVELADGEAIIAVSNEFVRSYIVNNFQTVISEALSSVVKTPVKLRVRVDSDISKSEPYTATIASISMLPPADTSLRDEEAQSFFGGSVDSGANVDYGRNIEKGAGMDLGGSAASGGSLETLAANANRATTTPTAATTPGTKPTSKPAIGAETKSTGYDSKAYTAAVHAAAQQRDLLPGPGNSRNADGSPINTTIPQAGAFGTGPAPGINKANLSQKYIFETFVVGSHNRFPYSAALAVAEKPGQAYNPFFIYGGVGLGKTHLMQAIGHSILKHSPGLTVRYLSCERFTNELINSIRDDRMMDFRKRYRQVDVLLVDDIQFIQGKESTQEEFFHTFNALRDSGRQIILSSDRPPKAISLLEERLRSRFEWGLIADIQAPDLETRLAILRKKCDLDNMQVSDEVLEYIAGLFTTNIRELEGALIRAHAYASLAGSTLTPAVLAGILQPVGPAQKQKVTLTVERITDTVASHYRVESSELRSSKRSQDLALPRHVAMYLAHELIQMSFPRIGQSFGNRKHTSALYAHSKVKESLATDADLAQAIQQIKQLLNV
jgi:chromosomal replication initiator protein